jgi:replicative DNA helicase
MFILQLFEDALVSFCNVLAAVKEHEGSEQGQSRKNDIIAMLQAIEERQKSDSVAVCEKFDQALGANATTLAAELGAIVQSAMQGLNADAICTEVWNKSAVPLNGILSGHVKDVVQLAVTSSHQAMQSVQSNIIQQVTALTSLKHEAGTMSTKLDAIEKQLLAKSLEKKSAKAIGKESEDRLFDALAERLKARDGYAVTKVSGKSHSCDLVVACAGHPAVRIESKCYEQKVGVAEVEKFKRDLLETNDHGLFVSLTSGIVCRSNFEVERLSNGKFAVYLADNKYDTEAIVEMVHLLYRLDAVAYSQSSVENAKDSVEISNEVLGKIQVHLRDWDKSIQAVKRSMRNAIETLSQVQLKMVEELILGTGGNTGGNTGATGGNTDADKIPCEWCGRDFKTMRGMQTHAASCAKRMVQMPIQSEEYSSV